MDPHVAAVGTSAFGRTDLTGRDLFSAAVAEAFADGPDPAEVVDALYVGNQSRAVPPRAPWHSVTPSKTSAPGVATRCSPVASRR